MVSSIRVALLPLAATIISSVLTYISGLTSTNPFYALIINAAVLGLTYGDSYITALENETPVTTTTSIVANPDGSTTTTVTPAAPATPPTPPVLAWPAFLALAGTPTTAEFDTVIATATNPAVQNSPVWYAVAADNGTIVLTTIEPT